MKNSELIKNLIALAKTAIAEDRTKTAKQLTDMAKELVAEDREKATGKKPISSKPTLNKPVKTTAKKMPMPMPLADPDPYYSGGGCGRPYGSSGGGCGR